MPRSSRYDQESPLVLELQARNFKVVTLLRREIAPDLPFHLSVHENPSFKTFGQMLTMQLRKVLCFVKLMSWLSSAWKTSFRFRARVIGLLIRNHFN